MLWKCGFKAASIIIVMKALVYTTSMEYESNASTPLTLIDLSSPSPVYNCGTPNVLEDENTRSENFVDWNIDLNEYDYVMNEDSIESITVSTQQNFYNPIIANYKDQNFIQPVEDIMNLYETIPNQNLEHPRTIDDWKIFIRFTFNSFPNIPSSVVNPSERTARQLQPTTMSNYNLNITTKQCLDAISDYMVSLVEKFTTTKEQAIKKISTKMKEAFISEEKPMLGSTIGVHIILASCSVPRFRSIMTEEDFTGLNLFINERTSDNKESVLNWVVDAMRNRCHGINVYTVEQWINRDLVATKYFNSFFYRDKKRELIVNLKLALYNLFVIVGSEQLLRKAAVNLQSFFIAGTEKDEFTSQLNAFRSHYFQTAFFDLFDSVTKLWYGVHTRWVEELHELFDFMKNAIFATLKIPANFSVGQNVNEIDLLDAIFVSMHKRRGIIHQSVIDRVINEINDLRNNWIGNIEVSNYGNMTQESYRIAIFLELLKDIVIVSGDAIILACQKTRYVNTDPSASRRRIFRHIFMLNFDFEKIHKSFVNGVFHTTQH